MHRSPDEFGFGSGTTNHNIEENTRALKALIHYIKWMAEKQTGEKPPSFLEEPA